jgi:hypothetical protein
LTVGFISAVGFVGVTLGLFSLAAGLHAGHFGLPGELFVHDVRAVFLSAGALLASAASAGAIVVTAAAALTRC